MIMERKRSWTFKNRQEEGFKNEIAERKVESKLSVFSLIDWNAYKLILFIEETIDFIANYKMIATTTFLTN